MSEPKPFKLRRTAEAENVPLRIMAGFQGLSHPDGGETSKDERRPYIYTTTLTGEIGNTNRPDDNSYHVVSAIAQGQPEINMSNGIVLDGFTITKGYADDPNSSLGLHANGGGGILIVGGITEIDPVHARPTIVRCRFIDNYGVRGGAVMNRNPPGTTTFSNCEFRDNQATIARAAQSITIPSILLRALRLAFKWIMSA